MGWLIVAAFLAYCFFGLYIHKRGEREEREAERKRHTAEITERWKATKPQEETPQ
jgi:hypothetical protein